MEPGRGRAHALDHLVGFERDAPETSIRVQAAVAAVPHADNLTRLAELLRSRGDQAGARRAIERARAGRPALDDLQERPAATVDPDSRD